MDIPKSLEFFWGGISGNKGKMPKNGWNCQDVYVVGAVLAETCENPIAMTMIPLGSLMRSVDQTPTMMEHDGTWWNMMEHDGTWWNMMEHDGTWWNMMEHDGTWWNTILPYFRYPKNIPKGSWSTKKAPRVPSPSLAFFICPSSPWLGGTCYIAASKQPYLLGFGLPGYRNCMEFLGCEKSECYRKNL